MYLSVPVQHPPTSKLGGQMPDQGGRCDQKWTKQLCCVVWCWLWFYPAQHKENVGLLLRDTERWIHQSSCVVIIRDGILSLLRGPHGWPIRNGMQSGGKLWSTVHAGSCNSAPGCPPRVRSKRQLNNDGWLGTTWNPCCCSPVTGRRQ